MQIAMHELKVGLSRYVAKARAGETIEVTSHDKPVARIIGIQAESTSALGRLIASRAVDWQGGKPTFQPPISMGSGGKTLSETVLEDRG